MLSLERYGDQQLRRRACPEFVADWAMFLMLLEVILFYMLNFTSKKSVFTLDKKHDLHFLIA